MHRRVDAGMLSFSSLTLRRSSQILFEAVSFNLHHGQKLGITGANGCGKSSLFALICGELGADQGDFSLPADWTLATVAQETPLDARSAIRNFSLPARTWRVRVRTSVRWH